MCRLHSEVNICVQCDQNYVYEINIFLTIYQISDKCSNIINVKLKWWEMSKKKKRRPWQKKKKSFTKHTNKVKVHLFTCASVVVNKLCKGYGWLNYKMEKKTLFCLFHLNLWHLKGLVWGNIKTCLKPCTVHSVGFF